MAKSAISASIRDQISKGKIREALNTMVDHLETKGDQRLLMEVSRLQENHSRLKKGIRTGSSNSFYDEREKAEIIQRLSDLSVRLKD